MHPLFIFAFLAFFKHCFAVSQYQSPTRSLPLAPLNDDYDHYKPTPVRPFTVAAFMSPYPPGTSGQISGYTLRAQGGSFYLNPPSNYSRPNTSCRSSSHCPPGNETVLFVDRFGFAWLDSTTPQQIYMDSQTGMLSYLTPLSTPPYTFTDGALAVGFSHLGQGTEVAMQLPPGGDQDFYTFGPSSFQWSIATFNTFWFACPRPGPGYQVFRQIGAVNSLGDCVSGVWLAALDYGGVSPAAGFYL